MNHPTLDRDVAEAIYKLLGDTYETARICMKGVSGWQMYRVDEPTRLLMKNKTYPWVPYPDFSETIRLIPNIAEKLEWSENGLWGTADDLARDYMLAPSPEQGIKEVSNYLRKVL